MDGCGEKRGIIIIHISNKDGEKKKKKKKQRCDDKNIMYRI